MFVVVKNLIFQWKTGMHIYMFNFVFYEIFLYILKIIWSLQ